MLVVFSYSGRNITGLRANVDRLEAGKIKLNLDEKDPLNNQVFAVDIDPDW